MDTFTPMNEQRTKRLHFRRNDIRVLAGNLFERGYGYHATIAIKGSVYNVYGISCGLSGCVCDAYITQVKQQ